MQAQIRQNLQGVYCFILNFTGFDRMVEIKRTWLWRGRVVAMSTFFKKQRRANVSVNAGRVILLCEQRRADH